MTSTTTDRRTGVNANAAIKVACRACSTTAITLSGEQTVDGVALVSGDRFLYNISGGSALNGIYVVDTGTWTRDLDADGPYDFEEGTIVKVNQGTANSGIWYLTTAGSITPGTTSISFSMLTSTLAAVSAFMQTMLDDTTAAAARATLLAETKTTVASVAGATADIWTGTGHLIDYTGTQIATGFANAPQAGAARELLCAAASKFTAGTNFVVAGIPSGYDYTAAAGDRILVMAETTTKFLLFPLRANGKDSGWTQAPGVFNNASFNPTMGGGAVLIHLVSAQPGPATPSASTPVTVTFRGEFLTSNSQVPVQVTAANSITIPAGATLGTLAGVASRIWVAALLYTGGASNVVELAVMNASDGAGKIFPIDEGGLITTTTISTGSDSAGVWYSTTGRTAAFAVLGYFESTQGTPGTWATAASSLVVNPPHRPGDVIQSVPYSLGTVVYPVAVQVPWDNSPPLSGEGALMMTHPGITPTFAGNILEIEHNAQYANATATDKLIVTLNQDGGNALKAIPTQTAGADLPVTVALKHTMVAGTASATVFTIRAGTNGTNRVTMNGAGGTQTLGGVSEAHLDVIERFA